MTLARHLVRLAAAVAALSTCVPAPSTARPREGLQAEAPAGTWGSLEIPGTPSAVLEAVGLDENVSRTRLMLEVIRRAYESPDGDAERSRDALREHVSLLADLERRLSAAGGAPLAVSPARLASPETRGRLQPVLDFLGYRVRQGAGGRLVLEPTGDQGAAARRRRLRSAGIDVEDLPARLSAAGEVSLDLPRFLVPLPLGPETWRRLDAGRSSSSPLYVAVLGDRRAALLYAGLCNVDADTLGALGSMPALLQRLYDGPAAAFAAFGDGLHLREGLVAVPGDPDAVRVWESLVGEPVSAPERFVPSLFERDRGRLAYFFETVSALDMPRQRFALAAREAHPRLRLEQVEALYSVFQLFDSAWQPTARPFSRRPVDPARWLAELRVTDEGAWIGPRTRRMWERAFDGGDLSEEAGREVAGNDATSALEAGWLAGKIFLAPAAQQARRFEMTLFSQRVFPGAGDRDGDVLVALRGFLRFPTLSLTLERLALGDAKVHALAARRAQALTSIGGGSRRGVAVAQFQAALFLLDRCAWAGAFEQGRLEEAVRGLLAIEPNDGGRYQGRLAEWVETVWLPAIGADAGDREAGLIAALAGARYTHTHYGGARRSAPTLLWEGERYELDPVTPEILRIDRIREGQAGNRVEQVLDLARLLRELSDPATPHDRLADIADALGRIGQALRMPPSVAGIPAADLPEPEHVVADARDAIAAASGRGRLDRQRLEPLAWMVDVLLADTLTAITYAAVLGDPDGAVVRSGHVAARHDPGLTVGPAERDMPTAWELAQSVQGGGRGWSARGSLLLLDVALAPLGVRRLAPDAAPPAGGPAVPGVVLVSLARTLALWNAFALDDPSRDAIAHALARGRARLEPVRGDPAALAAALRPAGVEAARRHQAEWAAREEPGEVDRLLSLTDVMALGRQDEAGPVVVPRAWASEAISRNGCVCLQAAGAPGPFEVGRPVSGLLGAHLNDIGLRLAELTAELALPAGLARALLAGEVYDFAFDAAPVHEDDWLGLVRGVDAITRDRIEEYIAVLTFDGPLTATAARPENKP